MSGIGCQACETGFAGSLLGEKQASQKGQLARRSLECVGVYVKVQFPASTCGQTPVRPVFIQTKLPGPDFPGLMRSPGGTAGLAVTLYLLSVPFANDSLPRGLGQEPPPCLHFSYLYRRVSQPALVTFGAGFFFAVGNCPVHCRRLNSIPGLYPV